MGVLSKIDINELTCEYCGQQFHYDHIRHCVKCEAITCPICSTVENLCPECRENFLPNNIEPMLAKLGKLPARQDDYAFEFKWDGIRAITYWNGRQIRIKSRNLNDITFRYPELCDIGKYFSENAIVDGEIIALDENNQPSFSLLQKRMHINQSKAKWSLPGMRIFYYIFDILFLDGQNLMDQPYQQRRKILEELELKHPSCKVPPSRVGEGSNMVEVGRKHKLEGVIAKKLDSVYQPGNRTGDWIKVKFIKTRELIIGGFKYSQSSLQQIGSLQLGAYDDQMNLQFVGSCGTGFSQEEHKFLLSKLKPLQTDELPFAQPVDRDVNYVRPVLIAQIEYRRWPADSQIQQSSYKGLRNDILPAEVTMEEK